MKRILASALSGLIAWSSLGTPPVAAQQPGPSAIGTYVQSGPGQVFLGNGADPLTPVPFSPLLVLDRAFGQAPGYDANYTTIRGVLPWHVDPGRTVIFGSVAGAVTDDSGGFVGNFGGGLRRYVSEWDRIFGVNGFYDVDDGHEQTYHRAGIGVETLGRFVDARLNTYHLIGDQSLTLFEDFVGSPFFMGRQVVLPQRRIAEAAYDGVDGEIGGLLPLLGRYGLYGYVGGYHLSSQDEDAESTTGYSVHLQAIITDDVTFDTRYARDDVFGGNLWFNVSMTIPDGKPAFWFQPKTVHERMIAPVERRDRVAVALTDRLRNVPLTNPKDDLPLTVIHVDPTAVAGDGSFENPFGELETARVANDPTVDVIFVRPNPDGSGTDLVLAQPFQLFDCQRLLSSSVSQSFNTNVGVFDVPALTPGVRPLVTLAALAPSAVIIMADETEVSGFRIDGSGRHDGILVPNAADFNINRNIIVNGRNGIAVIADNGGRSFGTIRDNDLGGHATNGIFARVTNNSRLEQFILANRFGLQEGGPNRGNHFQLLQDSGTSLTVFDGNRFGFLSGTGIDFQISGSGDAQVAANNNVFGAAAGGDVTREGFNANSIPPNDDGSTQSTVPIGFAANFFGLVFNELFVNNNGNVTFQQALGRFTPFPILTQGLPIIAPFFADVDTRQGNVVTFGQGTINGRPAFGVNWLDVRHFSAVGGPTAGLPTNSFQLVLVDRSDIAPGDFDIEFNYDSILWEAGEASGGNAQGLFVGPLGGPARVGFSNGINTAFELPGSGVPRALLDSGPPDTSLVQNSRNSGVLGRYIFEARGGDVLTGAGGDAVRINATGNAVVSDASFTNNQIRNVGGNGMSFQAGNAAAYRGLRVINNIIDSVGLNGLNFVARDSALMQGVVVQGNTITTNAGHGIFMRAEDASTILNPVFDSNIIRFNQQDGLHIEIDDTAQLSPLIRNNVIEQNEGDGIQFLVGGVVVFEPSLEANLIQGNLESGIEYLATDSAFLNVILRDFAISNNVLSGVLLRGEDDAVITGTIQRNRFLNNGNGLVLERTDDAFFRNVLIGDAAGQSGQGNLFSNNAGAGVFIFGAEDDRDRDPPPVGPDRVNTVAVNGNEFTGNRDGVFADVRADAIFLVNAQNNLFSSNSQDGIRIEATGNGSFGNPLGAMAPSVFEGNTFVDNGRDAIHLLAADDAYMNVLVSGDLRRTSISGGQRGIHIRQLSTPTGGLLNRFEVRGTDIDGVDDDGIRIFAARPNDTDQTFTATAQSLTIIGSQAPGRHVTVTNAGDDGLDATFDGFVIDRHSLFILGDAAAPEGQRTEFINNGRLTGAGNSDIDGERGDGLVIRHEIVESNLQVRDPATGNLVADTFREDYDDPREDQPNIIDFIPDRGGTEAGDLDVHIFGIYALNNAGRGLTIDERSETSIGTYEVGDLGVTSANEFSSNGLQGMVFQTVAQTRFFLPGEVQGITNAFRATRQAATGNTDLPVGEPFEFVDPVFTRVQVESYLLFQNNVVRFNGQRAEADGLALLVGTNTYQHVDINSSTFGGNRLDDVFVTPIVSVDPQASVNRTAATDEDDFQYDPVAYLDLAFGVTQDNMNRNDADGDIIFPNSSLPNAGNDVRLPYGETLSGGFVATPTPPFLDSPPAETTVSDPFVNLAQGRMQFRFQNGFTGPTAAGTERQDFFDQVDVFKYTVRPAYGNFQVHASGLLNDNTFIQQGIEQDLEQEFINAGFNVLPQGMAFPDPFIPDPANPPPFLP